MKTAVGEVQGEALTLVNTTNTAIAAESGSLPVLGTRFPGGLCHPGHAGPDGKGHLRGGGRPAGGR